MKTSKADTWFSRYIRLRDCDENGLARCCTCGRIKPVKEMDCGHFVKRQHMATRFNPMNCAAQCKRCNAFEQGKNEEFERYLINRWGQDRVNLLKSGARQVAKYNASTLLVLEIEWKQAANALAEEKGFKWW